jgi:protein-S-isoprenylcysteine O-methyltransferase Ste14
MNNFYQPVQLSVIFWVTFISWVAISFWEGKSHQPTQTTREGRRSDLVCFIGVGIVGLFAIFCKGKFPDIKIYNGTTLFWAGIGLIWTGILLRHTAVRSLGKYHVMTIFTEDGQPVITSGPYRYIRHPSYLGALIAIIGIAFALNSLPGAIVLVSFTAAVLMHRIQIEDKYLSIHLGEDYRSYTTHTYRLVPFIW